MPKTTEPVFTQNIKNTITTFTNTDGVGFKTIATAGLDDSRITMIVVTTDEPTANSVYVGINDGTNNGTIGWTSVPASAGTSGVDAVVVNKSVTFTATKIDTNANPYFEIAAGSSVVMRMGTAIAVSQTVTVVVIQEDY